MFRPLRDPHLRLTATTLQRPSTSDWCDIFTAAARSAAVRRDLEPAVDLSVIEVGDIQRPVPLPQSVDVLLFDVNF